MALEDFFKDRKGLVGAIARDAVEKKRAKVVATLIDDDKISKALESGDITSDDAIELNKYKSKLETEDVDKMKASLDKIASKEELKIRGSARSIIDNDDVLKTTKTKQPSVADPSPVETSAKVNQVETSIPTGEPNTEQSRKEALEGLSKIGAAYIDEDNKLKRAKSDFEIELENQQADRDAAKKAKNKLAEEQVKRLDGAQKAAPNTVRYLRLYGESLEELKSKIPEIEEEGFEGWVARKRAELGAAFDEFPITRALNVRAKVAANQQARDIEGGRVTDDDRAIYANAMANAMIEPTSTNVILAAGALSDLLDKGASIDNVLVQFIHSDRPIFQKIANRILEDYPELIPKVYGEDFTIVEE